MESDTRYLFRKHQLSSSVVEEEAGDGAEVWRSESQLLMTVTDYLRTATSFCVKHAESEFMVEMFSETRFLKYQV